jgi:hypothetical protein
MQAMCTDNPFGNRATRIKRHERGTGQTPAYSAFFFALAKATLARVFRARCDSESTLPFSRQQGLPGRASQVGHLTSCALSFIRTVYAKPPSIPEEQL